MQGVLCQHAKITQVFYTIPALCLAFLVTLFNSVERALSRTTHQLALLVLPFDQGVVHERIKDTHECILVISQKLHCDLTTIPEDTCAQG